MRDLVGWTSLLSWCATQRPAARREYAPLGDCIRFSIEYTPKHGVRAAPRFKPSETASVSDTLNWEPKTNLIRGLTGLAWWYSKSRFKLSELSVCLKPWYRAIKRSQICFKLLNYTIGSDNGELSNFKHQILDAGTLYYLLDFANCTFLYFRSNSGRKYRLLIDLASAVFTTPNRLFIDCLSHIFPPEIHRNSAI